MFKRKLATPVGTFRRSVFTKLLLSFVCILIFPLLIGTLLYDRMEQALIDHANESNQALLQQARLSIDSRMHEIDQLASQVAFDPTLELLLYGESSRVEVDEYNYIQLINDFKRYRTVSSFIDDYYVYLKDSDRILTTSIQTDPPMFFNHIRRYEHRDLDQMIRLLSQYQMKSFLPAERVQYSLKQRSMITSITSLPMGDARDVRGALVVMIDENELLSLLRETDQRDASFYILNEKMEVLSTTASDAAPMDGLLSRLTEHKGDLSLTIDDQDMMVSYTKSDQNNWTYVSVVPKALVLTKVHETKSQALWLVLICFIAGLSGSYYLAYKNHRPIRELIRVIMKGKNLTDIKIKNEYTFIKDELLTSMDEENTMRELLSRQASVIQSDFISRLIKGYVDTRTLTDKDLEFMHVRFPHPYYGVILLQIDDGRRFVQEDTEREWTLMRFILINLSNELFGPHGYAIELERERVVILLNHTIPQAHRGNDLDALLYKLKSQVEHKFRIDLTIAVSTMKEEADQIAEAYGEAVMALEYKLLHGESVVIYYKDVMKLEHHYFHYSIETESQLMNYAKSGDFDSVVKLLDQVFDINFKSRAISPEMGKCLFIELMSTVLKLLGALNMDEKLFFDGEIDPIRYMAKIGTADNMKGKLLELYGAICREVDGERSEHSERLLKKIQAYIEEHYTSNEISLTTIAEYCGLNPSYLSTFYKKQCGHNVSERITTLRIKLAKAYLEESELTIVEIAHKIGFTNDIGLIRVFKRVEGITPGKYRENVMVTSKQKAPILE